MCLPVQDCLPGGRGRNRRLVPGRRAGSEEPEPAGPFSAEGRASGLHWRLSFPGWSHSMHLRSVLVLLAALRASLAAQSGNGGNGDLDTTPMAIDANFTLTVTGGANQGFAVYVLGRPAARSRPRSASVSLDLLSPNFNLLFDGTLSPTGTASVTAFIPNDPFFLGLVLYMQGAVVDPGIRPASRSRGRSASTSRAQDSFLYLPPLSAARALGTGDALKDGRVLRRRRRQRDDARAGRDHDDRDLPALHAQLVRRAQPLAASGRSTRARASTTAASSSAAGPRPPAS